MVSGPPSLRRAARSRAARAPGPPPDQTRHIKVWSAACSSGQEPYSIAMVLADALAGHPGWSAEILATDLSNEILTQARSARYSQLEVNRGLPAALMVRHFERAGTQWALREPIRKMVSFRELNLAVPLPTMSAGRHRLPAQRAHLLRCGDEATGPRPGAPGPSPGWLPVPGRRGNDHAPRQRVRACPARPDQRLPPPEPKGRLMTDTTPTFDMVPAAEDIVSIATDVWSSLNLDLDQTGPALDDATITGSASVSISGKLGRRGAPGLQPPGCPVSLPRRCS